MAVILRRVVLALALAGIMVCVILLLNFTATNPTGRRYSSAVALTDGESNELGSDGERILGKDLGVSNNNAAERQQCICDFSLLSPPPGCNVCLFHNAVSSEGKFAKPDFVGRNYIAESKNAKKLPWRGHSLREISLYADTAIDSKVNLWLFVRVDTEVDPRYYDLVEGTGGGIVYYFTAPGYTDPTDRAATTGLIVCVPVGLALLFWEFRPRRVVIIRRIPAPRRTPRNKVDEAELFRDTMREKARLRLDQVDHE